MNAKRPRVLVVDPVHAHALDELSQRCDVVYQIHPSREELIKLLDGIDVLVMRSGIQLPGDVIEHAQSLKVIARAGSGVDNIDINAASSRNITVFNVPVVSARSVAEHAFGLLLAVKRNIALSDRWLRNNQWRKGELCGYELHGKVLGLVGYGRIGSEVARIGKGFGMKIDAHRKRDSEEIGKDMADEGVRLVSSLCELLRNSDMVILAVPLNDSTRNLITMTELQMMKETSFLVNIARGGIVDEEDLFHALQDNVIAGAATDVFEKEREFSPLFELDNVVVTPHIGAMTYESQKTIARILCRNIFCALDGKKVRYSLN